jgi:hypothetical protein
MKKKLSLRIEELNIDSFPVPADREPKGTVQAYETTVYETCIPKWCTRPISCDVYTC